MAASKTISQSHRVYWQQRLMGGSSSNSNRRNSSNNNLITGSAAVKIAPTAKASDLTNLLRRTLHLDTLVGSGQKLPRDALVLVGTLRSLPENFLLFEHEQEAPSGGNGNDLTVGIMTEGFHVIKTLSKDDLCLQVLEQMEDHLKQRQEAMDRFHTNQQQQQQLQQQSLSSSSTNHGSQKQLRPTIAPQTRWYYVPDTTMGKSKASQREQPSMSSCLELDGYITSLEEEDHWEKDDDSDDDDDDDETEETGFGASVRGGDEDLLRRALAPFSDPKDSVDGNSQRITKEWRKYLQISQSHATPSEKSSAQYSTTLAGYLLKRSRRDPHVWKRHYCVLTEDDFWYVPRIVRPNERNSSEEIPNEKKLRTILLAPYHGRIRLVDALLLDNNKTGQKKDGFDIVDGSGVTHKFRCPNDPTLAEDWRRVLSGRSQESFENSLLQHAELILTEETMARTGRWKASLFGDEFWSQENRCSSWILQFGLKIAEYKEGCRQMQSQLLSSTVTEAFHRRMKRLLRELWGEAASLLLKARSLHASIHKNDAATSSMETLCDHVEFVITQIRRRKKPTNDEGSESTTTETQIGILAEYPHHQRDPPPMDLFDGVWNELRTMG